MNPNSAVSQTSSSGQPPATRDTQYRLQFHGSGVDLALIILKNIALTIVTLGIYSFWGRVRVRKFLWQNSEFHGQRFAFHGTGKEVMIGYLKVVGIYIVAIGLTQGAAHVSKELGLAVTGLVGIGFLFLIPYAIYASQRYLYSRSSWRGIRLGMNQDPKPFMKAFIGGYLLTIITFGFYSPIWQNKLYGIRINNSYLGTMKCRYTGKDSDMFSLYLRSFLIILITFGIYFFWYRAKVSAYRAHHTWIGGTTIGAARGRLQMTGGDYFGLFVFNLVCIMFTGGLAMPWVIAHNMSFFLQRFSFVGTLDFGLVAQVASSGSATGDGLAHALDVGFGV